MNAASLRIRKVLMVSKGYLQKFPEWSHRGGVISVAGAHRFTTRSKQPRFVSSWPLCALRQSSGVATGLGLDPFLKLSAPVAVLADYGWPSCALYGWRQVDMRCPTR